MLGLNDMAKNIEVKLNIKGLKELRNDAGVKGELQKYGNRIAERANGMIEEGEGYVADGAERGNTRAHVNVHTNSVHAYYNNLKHNTLLKAMR